MLNAISNNIMLPKFPYQTALEKIILLYIDSHTEKCREKWEARMVSDSFQMFEKCSPFIHSAESKDKRNSAHSKYDGHLGASVIM